VARAGPPCAAKTQNPFMVAHVTGEIMAWLQRNFLCSPLLLIHLVFVHNWKKKKKTNVVIHNVVSVFALNLFHSIIP
jgi:hypothetical protein